MIVEVIEFFQDKNGNYKNVGDTIDVDSERAKSLEEKGLCRLVEKPVEKPKQTRRSK